MAAKPTAGLARDELAKLAHEIEINPSPRRVSVVFNGETIAQSERMRLVHETGHLPVYYFPVEDVCMERLTATDHSTRCPVKGKASYWSVHVGDRVAENAVWGYETPIATAEGLKGHLAFYWNAMDHWFEEDEEIFVHARDPYTRIDVVDSNRRVQVIVGGETVASSTRARFLYETGLPTRYYIPPEDVRFDLLRESDTTSRCPYKGTARYWSLEAGGKVFEDLVWSYRDPRPESSRIKDYLCFFHEQVDRIEIDGEVVPNPRTKWSWD